MEVINKKHIEITAQDRWVHTPFINIENENYIYFSAGAAKIFGLKAGLKINFINDGLEWLFYTSDDQDGFELTEHGDHRSKNAVIIYNTALIKLFLRRTRFSLPCKFFLTLTNAKHEGYHLVKIELNKPLLFNKDVVLNKKLNFFT